MDVKRRERRSPSRRKRVCDVRETRITRE